MNERMFNLNSVLVVLVFLALIFLSGCEDDTQFSKRNTIAQPGGQGDDEGSGGGGGGGPRDIGFCESLGHGVCADTSDGGFPEACTDLGPNYDIGPDLTQNPELLSEYGCGCIGEECPGDIYNGGQFFCCVECGNGQTSYGEECDDGNQLLSDACDTFGSAPNSRGFCSFTYCGDGVTQFLNGEGVSEECDDGNSIDDDDCSNTCTLNSPASQCVFIEESADFNCGEWTKVLRSSDSFNAHLELATSSGDGYPYSLCCAPVSGFNITLRIGRGNSGGIVSISGGDQPHLGKYDDPLYAGVGKDVYIEDATCVTLEASGQTGDAFCGTLGTNICVMSLSSDHNAHAGDCQNTDYPWKVCCSFEGGGEES